MNSHEGGATGRGCNVANVASVASGAKASGGMRRDARGRRVHLANLGIQTKTFTRQQNTNVQSVTGRTKCEEPVRAESKNDDQRE